MFKSKLSKVIVLLLRRVLGVTRSGAKRLMRAMLRSLMAMGRRANLPVAGFVLPTVTMVLLVVILLTVAITLRSFDRANTARNVRVNQQVLAAATPALDRAKAKIQFMLREDPQRPTATPSDSEMYRIISSDGKASTPPQPDNYTFGDEVRLKLKANLDSNPAISPDLKVTDAGFNLEKNESINTAWRYPVDTNNDGKYDTFTLYGIFFRSPPRITSGANAGEFERARKPLEARTPPMSLGVLKKGCEAAAGNIASLVGDSGWYSINGRLLKSFFVYTVNVPITASEASSLGGNYKEFTGTSSISALEYQQDQSRIPLSNNAVVYEDDLEISPGPPLNINGRMITNSNLLVTGLGGDDNLKLYQVSSPDSCFYEQENSKILVGGNVVNGGSGDKFASNTVQVHLFKKPAPITDQKISTASSPKKSGQSVTNTALDVLYNNAAFQERISLLVGWQSRNKPETDDPLSVQKRPTTQSREQALENYFKLTTRKIPFAEVPFEGNGIEGFDPLPPAPAAPTGASPILGSGENLRPIDKWNLPTDANTKLSLNLNQLEATKIDPNKPIEEEAYLGDRVVVGNSLPNKWWDSTKSELVSTEQTFAGKWNTDATDTTRTRASQITKLADVGAIDRGNGLGEKTADDLRDGFWEASAAQIPKTAVDGIGGLRVITSAGVYDRKNSFLPPPVWLDAAGNRKEAPPTINDAFIQANTYDDPAIPGIQEFPVVWPDTMPMSPLGPGSKVYNNNAAAGSSRELNWVDFTWQADGSNLPPAVVATATSPVVEVPGKNPQYAKGDLRMRASAVYHYAQQGYKADDIVAPDQPVQEPIACVSSYYDPSSALTALNIEGLANVSGQGAQSPGVLAGLGLPALGGAQPKVIGSNNGITYAAPTARPTGASTAGANGLLSGGNEVLNNQANLVFPDGRFANGPLRSALQVEDNKRTLAQKAAIDSTLCAIDILGGATPDEALIPNGAIQEIAFLNGREIKAVDRDDPNTKVNEAFTLSSPLAPDPEAAKLTGNYNQPLEERQPLEIRATQIDLDKLRQTEIGQKYTDTGPSPEYLLPNSGIIYASRDDALPDRSDRTGDEKTSKRVSPSDSLLDPTRKPNGIVLINGKELFRGTSPDVGSVTDLVKQKGLILVSNLPVYIKGEFNLHSGGEEFNTPLPTDWTANDFYGTRGGLNSSFACRKGDPRLTGCGGDNWRQATVLADAVTLLSQNYRFGFRNEGDFDLRNNAGAAAVLPRRQQGFYNNNFVTNGLSSGAFSDDGNLANPGASGVLTDATYVVQPNPPLSSSYFNNFATPVQRRGTLPEYVMEVCTKLPVSECTDADWFVDLTPGSQRTALAAGTTYVPPDPANPSFQAGSTVAPPVPALQRFPRRVAFERDPSNPTQLLTPGNPQALAITSTGTITPGGVGRPGNNALWFLGNDGAGNAVYRNHQSNPLYVVNKAVPPASIDGSKVPLPTLAASSSTNPLPAAYTGSQPLLMPYPQITGVVEVPIGQPKYPDSAAQGTGWVSHALAAGTTFNLIVGAGDTPSRALNNESGDFNGGLQNLPRFLEIWSDGSNTTNATIRGSFVQQNRSAFSTAPYQPILPAGFPANSPDRLATLFALSPNPADQPTPIANDVPNENSQLSITRYNIQGATIPYFTPPKRDWGFDVGQLSQPPDLFTQRFTTPPRKTEPAEYFREVGRDDKWVQTLMCAELAADGTPAVTGTFKPSVCPPPA
ncbi:hormogonium polysaccharide biosynthesis protein HpsA [Microcoleus sp. N3A4]|uniref:hormogonium polysaccharide biosynthesis protein HpsA n=1 Tax=Microcoleus sp. N3A4 TaxID=3055379 RepID=UPI002FD3EDAA